MFEVGNNRVQTLAVLRGDRWLILQLVVDFVYNPAAIKLPNISQFIGGKVCDLNFKRERHRLLAGLRLAHAFGWSRPLAWQRAAVLSIVTPNARDKYQELSFILHLALLRGQVHVPSRQRIRLLHGQE
jgi:hypothetical protein